MHPIEATPDYQLFCQSRLADPYPFYHRLRTEDPVHFSDTLQTWMLTSYDDVAAATGDARLSSDRMQFYLNPISAESRPKLASLCEYMSRWMSMKDPPDHTRLRGLVNKAFTSRSADEMIPHIREISQNLIADLGDGGRADLIGQFAYPLPATVICEMLGIPSDEQTQFRQWSSDIVAFSAGSGLLLEAAAESTQESQLALVEYCRRIIDQRRRQPQDDLISRLISVEQAGTQLNELELYAMCVQLFVAGHETTTNLIGNGVLALLQHPRDFQQLREHPELIESAVEEFLRYNSPVQRSGRIVLQDMEINGKRLREGESLMLMYGAANRDPGQFTDPDRLILGRQPNRHMAFGRGPHFCVGAPLARLEAQVAFETILSKLTDIQLPDGELRWRPSMAMRGLESLEVEYSLRR
jgi:cytochrome P450